MGFPARLVFGFRLSDESGHRFCDRTDEVADRSLYPCIADIDTNTAGWPRSLRSTLQAAIPKQPAFENEFLHVIRSNPHTPCQVV